MSTCPFTTLVEILPKNLGKEFSRAHICSLNQSAKKGISKTLDTSVRERCVPRPAHLTSTGVQVQRIRGSQGSVLPRSPSYTASQTRPLVTQVHRSPGSELKMFRNVCARLCAHDVSGTGRRESPRWERYFGWVVRHQVQNLGSGSEARLYTQSLGQFGPPSLRRDSKDTGAPPTLPNSLGLEAPQKSDGSSP